MTDEEFTSVIRDAFMQYVEIDLPVIPICPADHRNMSFSHRQKCKSPGKMPAINDWVGRSETTFDDVDKWLDRNPYYNIGLPLGGASRIVGIDIDGTYGEEQLSKLSKGDLPDTWEFTTSGGRRLLYRLPPNVKTKKVKEAKKGEHEELALLCDGQQTVLPPSKHVSGAFYKWLSGKSPVDLDMADAPTWLLDAVCIEDDAKKEAVVKADDWNQPIAEGNRNTHLTKLAGSLLARRTLPEEQVILFLDSWNREYCHPPVERAEIVKMVKAIGASEAMKQAKKKSKNPDKAPFRASPMATRFIQWQKDSGYHWRYAADQGCFYMCDESIGPWVLVDHIYVNKLVRKLLMDVTYDGNEQWDSMHYVNETVNALKEILVNTEESSFDLGKRSYEYSQFVSVENGLLYWKDLELKAWHPGIHTTIQLPVKWDENARCPTWERALQEWIPDRATQLFLQEYVGLCLIPDTSFRTAVFLYGVGANGKSLFLDGIKMLFGSSIVAIPLHRLADRFETANLQNKLVNICGDIDAKYLGDTGVLKALIGGDTLRGEFKHGKSFDFVPVSRLMFSANQLPRVADKSAAWYSRWKFVEFPNKFPVNSAYKINLLSRLEKEKSGMLQWAVEGLRRVKSTNKFTESDIMRRSEEVYRADNDNVVAFIADNVYKVHHTGVDTTCSTSALFLAYTEWCETNGFKAVGQIEFVKRMQINGFEKTRRPLDGKTAAVFIGIKLEEDMANSYKFYASARSIR